MRFDAGQFAWIKIGASPFVFEEHPFSVASSAEHPERVEFTIKALGDFTELVGALRPGRRVFLDGPYGGFTIEGHADAEGFVMIAGGVGITPLLSMLRTLADRGDQRRHRLIAGARTEDRILLRDQVDELRHRMNLKVIEVVEFPEQSWRGEVGRIDFDLLSRVLPRRARHLEYFVCGPPSMVAGICQDLRDIGVPLRRIHTELFSSV
jgi:3-phenylpropionate/trans-cinnamate dioxygenase ferredoxin reductase subunit